MKDVVLYGKPGCHLCDEARDILLDVQEQLPFSLREVDILQNESLHDRYFMEIPVVTINDLFFCRYTVPIDDFRIKISKVCEEE